MKYITLALASLVIGFGSIVLAQELSERDQVHIAVQEICPVCGEKLADHDAPVNVKIGEEAVFLCRAECAKGQVDPQHWATIHANFAKAQRICPVMKQKLPKNPKWTIVEGQIVYVCCPPCIKKIDADPETYLQRIDELYAEALQPK